MGQFFEEIPSLLIPWIEKQKMYWVATAPLAEDGHVNVSPKGKGELGTFHIIDSRTVWYEDLSGSGCETISHLRENGRITIMFTAFDGPPQIVRLFGTGHFYEFGSPEYEDFLPITKRQPGSRAVIMIDVHKVGTSCGYSIPFYDFRADRVKLHNMAAFKELQDISASASSLSDEPPLPEEGLKWHWSNHNSRSIDGLPALQSAFCSLLRFQREEWESKREKDDESPGGKKRGRRGTSTESEILMMGFALGVAVCAGAGLVRRILDR